MDFLLSSLFLLLRYFSHVDVCYYHPDWHSVRVKGQFPRHAPSHLEVLTFQTFEPTEVKICLYQPSYRYCNNVCIIQWF